MTMRRPKCAIDIQLRTNERGICIRGLNVQSSASASVLAVGSSSSMRDLLERVIMQHVIDHQSVFYAAIISLTNSPAHRYVRRPPDRTQTGRLTSPVSDKSRPGASTIDGFSRAALQIIICSTDALRPRLENGFEKKLWALSFEAENL